MKKLVFAAVAALNYVKVAFRCFLMAENLDDLLAVHHLFNITFGLAQRFLLTHEVLGRAAADPSDDEGHAHNAKQHNQRHPDTVIHHDAEDSQDNDA